MVCVEGIREVIAMRKRVSLCSDIDFEYLFKDLITRRDNRIASLFQVFSSLEESLFE